jgi:hypothetical protein
MTLPTILFGFIISLLLGSGFHLWRGGPLNKLILYVVVGVGGFWVTQLFAMVAHIKFLSVGALQLGIDVIGCIACLFLAFILSNNPSQHEKMKKR